MAGGLLERGGSLKDDYVPYVRDVSSGAGPCYFRADVGYSVSSDPEARWAVTNAGGTFIGDSVNGENLEDSWFGEAGVGCGKGSSRGLRAELMLGVHSSRDFNGQPLPLPTAPVDPMHFSLRTYTAMLNVYKDLGSYGRFTPYVGAGVGAAYHEMSEVYFTGNPLLVNRIRGNSDLSLAWSLMAGFGYRISERAILDVGYRFIDLGTIESDRADSAGFVNPAVHVDDLYAHEIKVGLRYSFGGSNRVVSYK